MTKVFAKHPPYENGHLEKVIEDMKLAGPPTVRVMRFQGELYATEASHRLASAALLGLIPKVVIEVSQSNTLPDEHWQKVATTLPSYEYDHVKKLDLEIFHSDKYKHLENQS